MAEQIPKNADRPGSLFFSEFMQVPVNNRARLDVVSRALHKAIETELTPRQQEILMMRWFRHMRIKEIAAELELTSSTVSRTCKRAEQRIRKALRFYIDYLNCASLQDK